MTVEILVLRGINVGGHGKLPMGELAEILRSLGATDVKTYIQSGNAVYRGVLDAEAVSDTIEAAKGFRPAGQTRTSAEWQSLVAGLPFSEITDHKALHLFLTETESPTDTAVLDDARGPEERLARVDRGIWLHSPKYLSGSKIAARMERLLRVPTTARNWRTVQKLHDMAQTLT